MVEIARSDAEAGVYQKEIAENQGLSFKYLDHIMHGLKVAGLIRKCGKKGGYVLTREPSQITAYDIYKAFEANLNIIECLEEGIDCPREQGCSTQEFWNNLNNLILDHYRSVTLADLANRHETMS